MKPEDTVAVEEFETAEEFVAALGPLDERWAQPWSRSWIFRGQPDSSMGLVASALREHPAPRWMTATGPHVGLLPTNREQAAAEHWAVKELAHFLNSQGHPVPGENPHGHPSDKLHYSEAHESKKFQFPDLKYLELYALAQHHGVPTRLLDWTTSGLIAAYFAARCVMSDTGIIHTSDRICVWALQTCFKSVWQHMGFVTVDVVVPPWATTPNLRAQKAVFTVVRPWLNADEPPTPLPLDEALIGMVKQRAIPFYDDKASPIPQPLLRRLTLPRHQSYRLLELLVFYDVHGSSMFPGFDGAARAVRERTFWGWPPVTEH